MLRMMLAAWLTAAPLLATGQPMIYKVQMPDGSVLFSDTVPAGGKVLEEREAKSTPRVNTLPSQPGTRAGVAPNTTVRPILAPNKGAAPAANVEALERELSVAKRKLELGREPLPGERQGLAGGGSRLTPEYEARIAAMEREVQTTEAKLKSAYEARRN